MTSRVNLGKLTLVCFVILLLSTAVAAEVRVYNLTYDQVGNLKQGFGQYYEYNEFNQLARVRDNGPTGAILEEYMYDHEGNRLKKSEPQLNQTTYYISDEYIEVVNTTGTYQYVYYYEGDALIGREDPDNKKYFYHPDILGSTDLVTNESGGIVEETTYEPHGEVIEGGQTSEFLYTTKELDDQTGLYYFGARYYDPFFMHWIHPDETVTDVYNPQDLNRYAYVRNNPYKYVDPDGETPWDILDIAFIGYGIYNFARDPSLKRAGELGLDIGFAVLPIVPNVKRIKEAAKLINKADDVKDVGKAAEKVADIGKARNIAQEATNLRGAANPKVREAIKQGMSEHQKFYQQMGEKGMITNKAIPGTRLRPDAIDPNKRVIYELKPKTQSAIGKGENQLQKYQQAAKGAYSGEWRTQIRTYRQNRQRRGIR